MNEQKIKIARLYTLEGKDPLDRILKILHDQEQIAGVTVIRGIAGYGESGKIHTSSLLTLSLELPLIVEFFDTPEKIDQVIAKLQQELDHKHIISWPAVCHLED